MEKLETLIENKSSIRFDVFNNYEARQGIKSMIKNYSKMELPKLEQAVHKNKFVEFYLVTGSILEKKDIDLAIETYNKALNLNTPTSGALFEVSSLNRPCYDLSVRFIAENRLARIKKKFVNSNFKYYG
ncbi:MAG: hypothetical protein ACLFN8_01580 [Candidatus Woesearchaeota archaeon]